MKMNQKGRGEDGMQTPPQLYEKLNNIFQFNYDAACTRENCLCEDGAYFDEGMDGLKESWQGRRVFCNPPFSGKGTWIEKAVREVEENSCNIVVMVLPSNSMDSAPWHDFIYGKYHYEILRGRVSFIDPITKKPKTGNNSGTTIVYFMKKIRTK